MNPAVLGSSTMRWLRPRGGARQPAHVLHTTQWSSDRQLDPQALGDHMDPLYRAALAMCGSREEAEDLVQETFARVLRRPRTVKGDNDLGYLTALYKMSPDRIIQVHRGTRIQHERADRLLLHLFQHQIHHRGQAHAMLSGTTVKPPQLDEFFPAAEAPLRAAEFQQLGWTEEQVWRD